MTFTPTLADRVYALLKTVPRGRVTTYKALGDALGVKAYRRIGQILKRNPDGPHTPCHRVVASDGTIGGFMGRTRGREIKKKIAFLSKEGIVVKNDRIGNFPIIFYSF